MTTVKAIDFTGNEVEFADMKEIETDYGPAETLKARCGPSLFGFIQCLDCKKVSSEQFCGKLFVCATTVRSEPVIMIDNEPVREIVEIVK